MGFLTRLWEGLRKGIGLLLPFFAQAIDFRRFRPQLVWALRFLLFFIILIVLWLLNVYALKHHWFTHAPPPILGVPVDRFWLPILFLLLVAITWVVWWIYKILTEKEVSQYPDIDRDWAEAMQTLYRTGIDPTNVPLFLVLGRPSATEEYLFSATEYPLEVKKAPSRPEASVRVYGNHKAVFITCPGSSLLSRHAAFLAEQGHMKTNGINTGGTNIPPNVDQTMNPNQLSEPAQAIKSLLVKAEEEGRARDQLTEEEREQLEIYVAQEKVQSAAAQAKPRSSLLKNKEDLELYSERLKHVCRLIVRERHPYCPINGVLLTIPEAGTLSDEAAHDTGRLCQKELKVIREVLQIICPLFTLVCDMDAIPGFREFVKHFDKDQRKQRVGKGFPLRPDPLPDAEEMESWTNKLVQHICHSVIPNFVYKFLDMERPGRTSLENAVKENVELYHFMRQMHERQKRLARILALGIAHEINGPPLWGGCYLAGTGRDPFSQAFVHGVFNLLDKNQDYVSWTKEAITEERNYLRSTRLGYIGLIVYAIVFVFTTLYLVINFKK